MSKKFTEAEQQVVQAEITGEQLEQINGGIAARAATVETADLAKIPLPLTINSAL